MAAYCTNTQIKTALNITVADYDSQLTALAASASNWIDQYCNVPDGGFAVTTDSTRYYNQEDVGIDGVLTLDMPILSVTTLVDATGVTLPSNVYRLMPLNSLHYWQIMLLPSRGYVWTWTVDGLVAVTGKFGWSATPPTAVVEATTMLAGWMFKRYQAALQDSTANQDLGQLIYSEAIPKQVVALLSVSRVGYRLL